MESFESRLERLTPEQRREVEDFVEFLLQRTMSGQASATISPPPIMLNTPPVFSADPATSPPPQPALRMQDLILREEPVLSVVSTDPAAPMHEITVGNDDALTHDYMDYGRFDPQVSPATEAVKKVKQKIIAREAEDKSRHILDWVD
jgi:hypothetical protein